MSKTETATITLYQIDGVLGHDDNVAALWLDELSTQDATSPARLVNEDGIRETVLDAWDRPVTVADLRTRLAA